MRKNLLAFAIAAAIAFTSAYLFGAPKVSSIAGVLIEEGYTPLTLKRAGNEFYVSCKLNGRSASLIVDTGAGQTVIASALLRSLGLPLTKGEENVYSMMGLAGKNIKAGDIKDFQVERVSHLMGFSVRGCPAGAGLVDLPGVLKQLAPFHRCHTAILELWTPPESRLEDTIAKEAAWAGQSIQYLRPFFS